MFGFSSMDTALTIQVPARGKRTSDRGFSAVETLVSLLVVSFLAAFVMNVFIYSNRVQSHIHQMDRATEIARAVFEQIKNGTAWSQIQDYVDSNSHFDGYDVQILPQPAPQEGTLHLELTLTWTGAQRSEQWVFNTTVFDRDDRTSPAGGIVE